MVRISKQKAVEIQIYNNQIFANLYFFRKIVKKILNSSLICAGFDEFHENIFICQAMLNRHRVNLKSQNIADLKRNKASYLKMAKGRILTVSLVNLRPQ